MKNKITVVAYLNNIMDLYTTQRKPYMRTHAGNIEKMRISSAHARHEPNSGLLNR